MYKRPQSGETEEDILRMQKEYLEEKQKNPQIQPAAKCITVEKPCKSSLFAKLRQKKEGGQMNIKVKENAIDEQQKSITDLIIGDIVERSFDHLEARVETPENIKNAESRPFPEIEKIPISLTNLSYTNKKSNRSLFAQAMASKLNNQSINHQETNIDEINKSSHLEAIYGSSSVIVEDAQTAKIVHDQNLNILKKMNEKDILSEKQKLIESLDTSLINLLNEKRKAKTRQPSKYSKSQDVDNQVEPMDCTPHEQHAPSHENANDSNKDLKGLPDSNPAIVFIQECLEKNWLNFNVVENDKLQWMYDINMETSLKLKPGEKFEARFDWKGVLLPYQNVTTDFEKDERELYLHGNEPERPGYTLQELFRLARSTVMQQRLAAFNAISGILNIYQQGFYDQVLELPIAKIFFLLRYGFDENTLATIEAVSKGLSYLFYNDTDEILLDFCYDNPGGQWQPILEVLPLESNDDEDPCSIESLQKHIEQLEISQRKRHTVINASVKETEEESNTSMSDFQLAETNLIECFLRTNILQRIYYVLSTIKPENSTVTSCFKLLIRLARTNKNVALDIVNNQELMICLFKNFLPGLERVDATKSSSIKKFYNYPQYLCLKLLRILISTELDIAFNILNKNLVNILENYLFTREDLKNALIKVQIESLRILKCLFLLRCDDSLYKTFLPALRYMLDWHYNHDTYKDNCSFLIRQHAAALLATITAIPGDFFSSLNIKPILHDVLLDCCCKWFSEAVRFHVIEFSQITLLTSCLNVFIWYARHNDWKSFEKFLEKYLEEFIEMELPKCLANIQTSSILLHNNSIDRRNVFKALPNVGSILLHKQGPHLIITQKYPMYLLTTLWSLMELLLEQNDRKIFNLLSAPMILEPLTKYLSLIGKRCNRYLSTNFFVKSELQFIDKLLAFKDIHIYTEKREMFYIVYNFVCCLTADYIPQIERLFECVIFHSYFLRGIEKEVLRKWRLIFLEFVHEHYIVVSSEKLTLSMPFTQTPILPPDWPYLQLKLVLKNYIENVQCKHSSKLSELEILQMTLNFVDRLDTCIYNTLEIVTPTEKLMYYMICFMGNELEFLQKEMHDLLEEHLVKFYKKCEHITFDFEKIYQGKCKFENLYALFVEHFQAASYGDELFGSLVMVPLAQKYDNKWRRRIWSDYAGALRYLNCPENLLIGGLNSYLEPVEDDESLLKAYSQALGSNLLRINSIPYKIAKHHVMEMSLRQQNQMD